VVEECAKVVCLMYVFNVCVCACLMCVCVRV